MCISSGIIDLLRSARDRLSNQTSYGGGGTPLRVWRGHYWISRGPHEANRKHEARTDDRSLSLEKAALSIRYSRNSASLPHTSRLARTAYRCHRRNFWVVPMFIC